MIKAYLAAGIAAAALTVHAAAGVPSADIDKLTLSFIKAKIYQGGAVSCQDKAVGARTFVGCRNRTTGGSSQLSLWLYEDRVFKSVNGTARGFAQGQLSGQKHIATMPLPLPSDINISAAMAAFQ